MVATIHKLKKLFQTSESITDKILTKVWNRMGQPQWMKKPWYRPTKKQQEKLNKLIEEEVERSIGAC